MPAFSVGEVNYRHLHTHPFNGPLSRTTRVSRYQKGKTNLDFTEARDSGWHRLGHMQVCIALQTDNYASTPPLKYFTGRMPSFRPTNSVKALKALTPVKTPGAPPPSHSDRRRLLVALMHGLHVTEKLIGRNVYNGDNESDEESWQ